LKVLDAGAVAGFKIQNLPNVVQYVIDVSNGDALVITAPMDDSGPSGFRLFYGEPGNMIERPITSYSQALSGPATIAFGVGPTTYTLQTMWTFGPDAGPLGMPSSVTLDTGGGTIPATIRMPTPVTLSGFAFTCSTDAEQVPSSDGSSNARSAADANAGACAISASSYDQSCNLDTDCVEVTSTNYCEANCLCGGSAINVSAMTQFNEDVSKTPLASGALGSSACPCPSSFGPCCRASKCTATCFSPADTLTACVNAGGACFFAASTTCSAIGPPDACAYSDEVCCAAGFGGPQDAGGPSD
jgi:hypothetical protein